MLASLSAYTSTQKMSTSTDFWRYIQEDRIHRNHHCENLKSCSIYVIYMLFGFTFKIILSDNLLNQKLYWGLMYLFNFPLLFVLC
jgi:hypothetical protein